MIVLVDTNVLVDLFTARQPHYKDSAEFMTEVFAGTVAGVCASHCLTTLHYLVTKQATQNEADASIAKVLSHLDVVGLNKADWIKVQALALADFEDGAVAITAQLVSASFIITRNLSDFLGSPVPAISPADFMRRFIP